VQNSVAQQEQDNLQLARAVATAAAAYGVAAVVATEVATVQHQQH